MDGLPLKWIGYWPRIVPRAREGWNIIGSRPLYSVVCGTEEEFWTGDLGHPFDPVNRTVRRLIGSRCLLEDETEDGQILVATRQITREVCDDELCKSCLHESLIYRVDSGTHTGQTFHAVLKFTSLPGNKSTEVVPETYRALSSNVYLPAKQTE